MAKARKKTLPKDFEQRLQTDDLETLKALFDAHEIDARGGYAKQTALAFNDCPDDLARWLAAQGADLEAEDAYGVTPLQARSRHWQARIDVLLELGADPNRGEGASGTALHAATAPCNVATATTLLRHGARVDALDRGGHTPLARLLGQCSNAQIAGAAALAEVLLAAGARRTPEMRSSVTRIGTDFEFHRAGFNPDFLAETDAGLARLYALFEVPPVPQRVRHDGASPIRAKASSWRDAHQELWVLLVPSKGAAETVQGEVIRITGRISDEIDRNGGVNWDGDYDRMARALLAHLASGTPLPTAGLTDARASVAGLRRNDDAPRRLCELAVAWVALNPTPMKLGRPDYRR
ncbi:ankyrin repeat domain-containing protein [Caulobacter mirabilis]|uniref:Uncharacterized protein n=1 Tax=Caulobacter mirabilis TaxID=69666 RepID=A0A2D2AVX5_9CAUL|nr:ankyrin repeat domain-containing protein [Caulobacter mirabilis]ATQ42107.1 hypothetical protein CSW64_06595 [Caulobacter mirabilis]